MITKTYPFIYTRTKYQDYRILTTASLKGVPIETLRSLRAVVRGLINTKDEYLDSPSWALVKDDSFTIWGIACMNRVLSGISTDLDNRQVRGFFGILIPTQNATCLPSNIEYFRRLYETYVAPVWDSRLTDDSVGMMPLPKAEEIIIASGNSFNINININQGECRYYPVNTDYKAIVSEILGTSSVNSLAVNVHDSNQLRPIGLNDFSFMNVVMDESFCQDAIRTVKLGNHHVQDNIKPDEFQDTMNDNLHSCPRDSRKDVVKGVFLSVIIIVALCFLFMGDEIWGFFLGGETESIVSEDYKGDSLQTIKLREKNQIQ